MIKFSVNLLMRNLYLDNRIRQGARLKSLLMTLMVFCISACGGGDSEDPQLSQNACSLFGLTAKIVNGSTCGGTSPVVRLNIGGSASCTGTVISNTKVITAAHCIVRNLADNPSVLPENSVKINSYGLSIQSKKFFLPDSLYRDLSRLKKLFGNFQTEDSKVANKVINNLFDEGLADVAIIEFSDEIPLPSAPLLTSQTLDVGTVFAIFGFGLADPNNFSSGSDEVRSGTMLTDQVGLRNFGSQFRQQGSNTCFGDSGGPAMNIDTKAIVGITSLGSNNCKVGELSIYTGLYNSDIAAFLFNAAPEASYL